MKRNKKYINLIEYLKKLDSIVVAFSGGVDSTFLLKAAKDALGNNVKAVTIVSPYIPKWEIKEAKELVKSIGVHHEIINVPLSDEIKNNPEDRCYLCKGFVFKKILETANNQGYKYVVDGSNLDDTKDYRPGMRALDELNIKSPLLECGLTKDDIRDFSKELGLKTWNKPAYACLLTRIPYGIELTMEEFERIEKSEVYMMSIGFRAVRVRSHGDLARIEISRNKRNKLFDEKLLDEISNKLKEFGYNYVTLDMEGYRMGSLNETLDKK